MKNNRDSQKQVETLFLRDHFAAYRTDLANERTLLAYIRTALAFFIIGVSFIKFFGHLVIEVMGWFFILVGMFVFIKGYLSFKKMKYLMQEEEKTWPPKIIKLNSVK